MEGFFEEARKEMFTCYGEFPEVVQETCQVLEKLGCSEKKLINHPRHLMLFADQLEQMGNIATATEEIAGPPCKGKSCLKHLLVHDKPKEVKTSTGVMEKPDVVTISAEKYAVEGTSVWLPLTDDKMASSIKSSCQKRKYHIPEDSPEDRHDKLAQPVIEISPPTAASKATSRSSRADPSNTESDSLYLQPSANTADVSAFHQAHFRLMRDPSLGEGILLNDAKFVHLLDTGGQPSFQDVLPLLLDVPCTYVLVFNAAEGLNAPVPIMYRPDDTTVVESGSRPKTAWAMMLRSLSSVYTQVHNVSGDVRALLVDNCLPPLRTVVVGTFKDQLEQMGNIATATEEISRQIKQLESKPYYSSLIPNSDGQLFHLVNNLPHQEASERTLREQACINNLRKVLSYPTKFTESTLKQEVVNHLYPPAINVVVQYERPPEPNCTRSSVHLYIDGLKEGRVNFTFEVFNINPVGLCNGAACALLTHTPEYELKATAMDHGNSRQHVELLKEFLDVISSELDVKEKGRATIEERLKKTEQDLKAKEKECYAFETAQLDLLQQVEELKREKQLLEAREMQRDAELVQMRGELAKAEAACGQLEKQAAMKEENEALKHWQKKAKKVDELENQLNKQGIEFATERRACVELQERLEREVVAKTNLERERDSAVERAECLQAQLIEMHTDLQKLRNVQVLKLYERTCFIEELKESEQQLKDEVKALKRKMQHIEEQLEATRQHLKAKEEECYAFESTQLDLLQQVEELKFPSGEHKSELVQLREELKAKDDAVREMYSKVKELHVVKAQLEATLVNYEANKNQLESAQLLKFKAFSERDRYMEMTSTLQEKLLDKEEAKMACEKEIHILRRELEATKKRYQDLKDEKETLVDQQFVDLDDLRSRFSALQSELEAVREEHDVVKLHRYLYNSNLRQMVSEHLHMRDKLLVVVKDSLDTMQEKIIHNVKDFTGLDTAQETVAEHVKEAESQYKAAEKELRKLERVAENYRRKLLDLPHPTEEQLWHHVVPVVGAKWREVATYLGLESHVITAVHVDQSSVEDNCLNALLRWMDGAGKQPKTWITVLEAMRRAGFNEPARELEVKIRSNSL